MNLSLPRTAKLKLPPMVGADIDAHARAMHIYLQDGQLYQHTKQRDVVRRTFGLGKRTLAKKCARKAGLPAYGVVGPALYAAMRDANAYDRKSDALIASCHKPPKPKLVEPKQGFDSLDQSLWGLYSQGRNMGLTDLGTYNPASRLPSGRPSDHAVYPAVAFDLGFSPATGYGHLTARKFFNECVGHAAVEYVILGSKIYSRSRGLHVYNGGGHEGHIHVSGRR